MRILNAAVGAVLLILVAGPALAGDCGGSCGGGGHRPPPGGGDVNINVNANASANAFAGASAGGYFNARAYEVGGIRGRGYGGGTVYVGGGYGGDGGHYGGGAIYNEEVYGGRACASAPFGYVVGGFGREGRRPPACLGDGGGTCRGDDRGGRYGYSERRGCDGGRREESYGAYEESYGAYESYESYEEYGAYEGGYGHEPEYGIGDYERGYIDGRRSCGGCGHHDRGDAPYPPPYLPEPPRYEPPAPPARPYRPHRPRPSQPPRRHYSQEPGERG